MASGRTPFYLDFGASYQDHGLVSYLTKGDIQDNPDGSITIFPTTSEAKMWTFVFGGSAGLGGADRQLGRSN